ncbi:MAG: cation:proton antiporter [Actinomycetota bacterium]
MPSSLLLIELGAVIVGLALLARLAGGLGFSPIPLYLLAGLAFGRGGLLPVVTAEEFIETGAEIGVILLLLLLGLEYTGEELTRGLRTGAASGAADLVLNAAPGLAVGLLLGWGPVSAILLAGVTYISSSGIVAKLLSDLGWVGNRETPAVLSLLVLEDLVMAAYLPVVAVLLLGVSLASAVATVGAALAVAAAFLVISVRFGPALSRLIFSHSDEAMLLTILGVALLASGVAERLQVSAAVGAFLVGIGISGPAADRARTLLTPLRDLFGGVFFAFFGLSLDPAAIPSVLGPALALAAVGIATKAATGWMAGSRLRVGVRGRLRAGALLVSRGEFSIVIAALGAANGAHPRLAPVTAAYVLTLAVLGPILARGADRLGPRIAPRRPPTGATMLPEAGA